VEGYDAEVYFWARQDTPNDELEPELEATIRTWLKDKWPFENVAFPGKDMSLESWRAIEEIPK
jgi:hypothetical protein